MALSPIPDGKSAAAAALIAPAETAASQRGSTITRTEASRILLQAQSQGISPTEIESALVLHNFFDLNAARAGAKLMPAQEQLLALGYPVGNADGIMGPKTRGALKQFQKDHNLPQTGKVDEATAAALTKAAEKSSAPAVGATAAAAKSPPDLGF